jgi:hypothetical protein
MRKVPSVAYMARWYCPQARATSGLLPDFYASRMPGTLDALEETVASVEAADARPGDARSSHDATGGDDARVDSPSPGGDSVT